jgi:flavorubredoxin
MSQAAVIYDSNFGNNEILAQALSNGLQNAGLSVDILKIGEFNHSNIQYYELICLGGPTHIARASENMKVFLNEIKRVNLRGKRGFCFGTRMDSRMNIFDINGSAKKIEGKFKKKGVKMVKDAVNVLVDGREGPLAIGSEEIFNEIGYEIGCLIQQ